MMFDPYRKWLGILPKDQPPNHYRLLSLELFENDLDVIEGAADRAMAFVRQYQSGEHAEFAAKLLNELAKARLCLLKPISKAQYDAKLRLENSAQHETTPVPGAKPVTKAREQPREQQDDGVTLEFGTEPPAIGPVSKPSAKLASSKVINRAKPAKGKSSNTMFITGGIGAAVCVALVVVMNLGDKPPQKATTISKQVAETKSGQLIDVALSDSLKASARETKEKSTAKSSVTAETKLTDPNKSKFVVEPTGAAVDLLEAVELPRDQYVGDWKRDGRSLSAGPKSWIYFPVEFPAAYQLKLVVKRTSGIDGCCIGFASAGRAAAAIIDGWDSKFSGLCVDDREPTNNCTTFAGALFQTGQKATIVLTVTGKRVQATFDGKIIVDWLGHPERLFVPTFFMTPNREAPFFGTLVNSFEIQVAELTPIRAESGAKRIPRLETWLDVMPLLNTARDAQKGVWSLSNNTLQSPGSALSKYSLPVAVPEEYTLSAQVELPIDTAKGTVFTIGVVAGNNWCSIPLVDADSLGIEKIDGVRWDGDETKTTGAFITPRRPFGVACTVTKNTIRMDVDGRTVLNWTGDFRRLSPQDEWVPNDATKLMFGATTNFKIQNIKLGPPADPPGLPSHPKMEIGKPVDLISLIDPRRDTLLGGWSKEGAVVSVLNETDQAKLVVPCEVPTEYKLTMKVLREVGGKADAYAVLKLPTEHGLAQVDLDGWGSNLNGVVLDGRLANDPNNTSARRIAAIPPGIPQDLEVYVRRTGLKITSGKNILTEFVGNTERFGTTKWHGTPSGRIAFASAGARLRIERLEVEALEPSAFPVVKELGSDGNVLAVVEPLRDSRRGEWKLDAGGLTGPGIQNSRIRLPVSVPPRYVLAANVERKAGKFDFQLGLLVGGNPCGIIFDGVDGRQAGISSLDGKSFRDAGNVTWRVCAAPLFPIDESVKVTAIVLPDTVIVNCGNKEVVRWHGDSRRLSQIDDIKPPNYSSEDRDHLWLGSWDSQFLIRDLNLRPIGDDEAERIASRFTGVTPTTYQSNVPLAEAMALNSQDPGEMKDSKEAGGKVAANAPEQLSRGRAHNLLELVKLPEDSLVGKWTQQSGSLVCEPSTDADAKLMVPVALRGTYELDAEFTRRSGDGFIGIAFPVGLNSCSLFLGLDAGAVSGFGMIDGLGTAELPARSTAAVRPGKLVNGKRYQVHIDVIQSAERVTLLATLDGRKFVGWKGAIAELSPHWTTTLPCPSCVGLLVQHSQAEIHKLELRVKNEARAYPMGSDWKNPLSQVAPGPPKEILSKCVNWNGRKYLITEEKVTFGVAQRLAAQLRGRLLTISSPEEEAFIFEQGLNRFLWMSLWRREGSREWLDERNRPMKYVPKWGPREPNLTPPELGMVYNTTVNGNDRGMCDTVMWVQNHACIEWGDEYPDDE